MILKLRDISNVGDKLTICKTIKNACEIGLKEAKDLTDILFLKGLVDLNSCVSELRAGIPLDRNRVEHFLSGISNVMLVTDIEERNIKLRELITILKLLPLKNSELPAHYFSEIKHKDISIESGFCHISGKTTEDVDLDIYFSLNNYTIIC